VARSPSWLIRVVSPQTDMELRSGTFWWQQATTRVLVYSLSAMVVILLLFLWLVLWYDDIMPDNPPASHYENAFSLICTLAMWPFVVVGLILGRDPPGICWFPLWVLSGACWGFAVEWVRKATSRLRVRSMRFPNHRFTKYAVVQICIGAIGCALWFYVRASRILAHPTDPENYGTFGNNWRFQGIAFILSRLIPVAFGLVVLLVGEWYVRLLVPSRKGLRDETPD